LNLRYYILIACLSLLTTASAQTDSLYYIDDGENTNYNEVGNINLISLSIGQLLPARAFKNKLGFNPVAYNVGVCHQLKPNKPLFIGLEFSYSPLDDFTGDIEVDTEVGVELWSSTTTTSLKSFDLNALYYLPVNIGRLDVYTQFNLGFNWFSTRTTITPPGSDQSEGNYDKNDLVGRYGATLGLHYPLGQNGYIQVRVGYQAGLSAYYYTVRTDVQQPLDTTLDAFKLQKSATDALKWDLGYTFAF
jgi:hypothetical protein